jgi:hypothetical protein
MIGFAIYAQGGMAGAKKRRAGDAEFYKPATERKPSAHEQNPEFEMPYYRYQRASCQAGSLLPASSITNERMFRETFREGRGTG